MRLLQLGSLAALGMLFVFAVVDDRDEPDGGPAILWGVVGLAFLITALASATFIAASALVNYVKARV